MVAYLSRPVGCWPTGADVPAGARTVSIFVVNRRAEAPDEIRDEAFAFQVQLEIYADMSFCAARTCAASRATIGMNSVADLQYRDDGEYSVGHNVATERSGEDGVCCKLVRTCWIPDAEVEKVEAAHYSGC